MNESKEYLKNAIESPLAKIIREAIGVDPEEEVEIVTPIFHRTDGRHVHYYPRTKEEFDSLKDKTHEELLDLGLGKWSDDPTEFPGSDRLYLFPAEWGRMCIPNGYPIIDIFGNEEFYNDEETSHDKRFGLLAFGILRNNN